MTKYSILAFTPDVMPFLTKVQELGMVDITRSAKPFDEVSLNDLELAKRYQKLVSQLNRRTISGEVAPVDETPREIVDNADVLQADLSDTIEKLKQLEKEEADARVWGSFNREDISRLHAIGFTPHFYCTKTDKFESTWENDFPLQVLQNDADYTRFVVLEVDGEPFTFPLRELDAPAKSSEEYLTEIASVKEKVDGINQKLDSYVAMIPTLTKAGNELLENFDLYSAAKTSPKEAEEKLTLLEGFALTEKDAEVTAFMDGCDVVYFAEPATVDDNPPVVLKNNVFSRCFEAIGDLYVLPKYNEVDMTPWFAPFYMLFFGLCLGDMGYGLLLLLVGFLINWKVKSLSKYGNLIIWLGLGTVLMAALNGVFFGSNFYKIFKIDFGTTAFPFSDMKMFWFAIIFGIVHIIVARLVQAGYQIKQEGITAGLSNIGWCMLLVWITFAYAGSQIGRTLTTPLMTYILCFGGLALIILFSSQSKNIFLRFGEGVFALYDITGLFGDVLSYIRLFGLGCAGGILGLVMNSLALQTASIPYVGWLFCLILLIVGHLMVLGLGALGAFVHPMRLTFVEFYKNAGFSGGGKKYKPLKKNK
ncbi:MAG: hypothetical protein HUJ90_06895 [Bacteroidales bacterium]|nr:hypothetical protein [Bacteroidales bacterium]